MALKKCIKIYQSPNHTEDCHRMKISQMIIPGSLELIPERKEDARGYFSKVFNENLYSSLGLETKFPELYFSYSKKSVIRGLHFQKPPMELTKLVTCLEGIIWDVLLDLRVDSPTYKKHLSIELSAASGNILYIPPGIAHGFQVISDSALMLYKVSKVYSPELDSGVLWNSAGIDWPIQDSILSDRDKSFEKLEDFISPFRLASSSNE